MRVENENESSGDKLRDENESLEEKRTLEFSRMWVGLRLSAL